jgi:[ribosomal protein S5]-alanine N-acetyltransferase
VPDPELPVPSLADDVVRLRPWHGSDVSAMLDAFADPWFQRFSDWAPRTLAEAHDYLQQSERDRRCGERLELAIVLRQDPNVVLGGGSLNGVDLCQGTAAVGYWLAPGARRRGVACRAVRLVADWALHDLGLARLELTCGPDNEASQRVARRCGFSREGVLRSHMPFKDDRRDSVLFSLLPGELL